MAALVFPDLSNGNLITESHVREFKRNSNLIGNRNSNLLGKNQEVSSSYFIDQEGALTEPNATEMWAIMGQLKELHKKLDNLQLSLGKTKK